VRVIALSLWTWLVYVARRLAALVRPSRSHFTFLGPCTKSPTNIVFREITTFSVMLDVYRGMPSIYASYAGYDEIAHHFGADSREALRALRGLDDQIRQIDRMRRLYVRREYDLYILFGPRPDPMPAVPAGLWPNAAAVPRRPHRSGGAQRGDGRRQRKPGGGSAPLSGRRDPAYRKPAAPELPARLLRATRQRLEERLPPELLEIDWDLSRRTDIAVRNSGSLSHIYFDVTPQQMELSEVALLYPTLLDILIRHEGIGLVAGRDGEKVVVVGKGGSLWIGPAGSRLEGKDPLAGLPDPAWAADQLARLARFPHAGDLILLGRGTTNG